MDRLWHLDVHHFSPVRIKNRTASRSNETFRHVVGSVVVWHLVFVELGKVNKGNNWNEVLGPEIVDQKNEADSISIYFPRRPESVHKSERRGDVRSCI